MKLNNHEVEVISNTQVKVGCELVNRSDVEAVLREMDDYKPVLVPSKLPNYRLAVGLDGPYEGHLFVKTWTGLGTEIIVYMSPNDSGWNPANDFFDKTTVRLLTAEDFAKLAEGVKG